MRMSMRLANHKIVIPAAAKRRAGIQEARTGALPWTPDRALRVRGDGYGTGERGAYGHPL